MDSWDTTPRPCRDMYLFVYFFHSGIHLLKYLHFLATRCFFPFFATHSRALDSKSSPSSLLHRTSTNELLLNKRFGFFLYRQELGHRNPVDSWPRSLVLAVASIFQHTAPQPSISLTDVPASTAAPSNTIFLYTLLYLPSSIACYKLSLALPS